MRERRESSGVRSANVAAARGGCGGEGGGGERK